MIRPYSKKRVRPHSFCSPYISEEDIDQLPSMGEEELDVFGSKLMACIEIMQEYMGSIDRMDFQAYLHAKLGWKQIKALFMEWAELRHNSIPRQCCAWFKLHVYNSSSWTHFKSCHYKWRTHTQKYKAKKRESDRIRNQKPERKAAHAVQERARRARKKTPHVADVSDTLLSTRAHPLAEKAGSRSPVLIPLQKDPFVLKGMSTSSKAIEVSSSKCHDFASSLHDSVNTGRRPVKPSKAVPSRQEKFMFRDTEAVIQMKLAVVLAENNLKPGRDWWPQCETSPGVYPTKLIPDMVFFAGKIPLCILEIKSELPGTPEQLAERKARETAQLTAYRSLGIPCFVVRGEEAIPDGVSFVLSHFSNLRNIQ